ncbi:hypothetical protein WAI453_009475 [Rhynchosporium graminicola]
MKKQNEEATSIIGFLDDDTLENPFTYGEQHRMAPEIGPSDSYGGLALRLSVKTRGGGQSET